MKTILGSSSPFRQQVMRGMGLDFEVITPDIDEKAIREDDPAKLALKLANAKLDALLERVTEPAIVIAAGQTSSCNGELREKPRDAAEARRFLEGYASHPSVCLSAVAVANTATGRRASGLDRVEVDIDPIPDEAIDAMIRKGELYKCAGGVKTEDPLMKPYIRKVHGTQDSVMGLPIGLTKRLIDEVST